MAECETNRVAGKSKSERGAAAASMSAFGVTSDTPMRVVLQFRKDEAPYVRERIWYPTHRLKELPDEGLRLSFRAGGRGRDPALGEHRDGAPTPTAAAVGD